MLVNKLGDAGCRSVGVLLTEKKREHFIKATGLFYIGRTGVRELVQLFDQRLELGIVKRSTNRKPLCIGPLCPEMRIQIFRAITGNGAFL